MTVVLAPPVKVVTKVWCSVGNLTPDKAAWSFELRLDQVGDHDSILTTEMSLTPFVTGTKAGRFSVRQAEPLPLRASIANRYNPKTHMAAFSTRRETDSFRAETAGIPTCHSPHGSVRSFDAGFSA
jgi:hypothetical protein